MINSTKYTSSIILHVAIGVLISLSTFFAKLYLIGALVLFIKLILNSKNKNNEALLAAAYFTAAEVLLRMTQATPVYEFGKYIVIVFLGIGILYRGISRRTLPYLAYLALLIPGIIMAFVYWDYDTELRKSIFFNLSGPICLGLSAIYCFRRIIKLETLKQLLSLMLFPIIVLAVYLTLSTPNVSDALSSGTNSNFATSGGFGPNQVATALGLGLFVLLTRLIRTKGRLVNIIDVGLLLLISYRGLVTFSRGGVITGLACALAFLGLYYWRGNLLRKAALIPKIALAAGMLIATFLYTVTITDGLLAYRYTNKDAAGRLKSDITTGRSELIVSELDAFKTHPVFGVGVGRVKEYRLEEFNIEAATHNEFSRLISEHGLFGIFALIILIGTPLFYRIGNRTNDYFFAFFIFWALTIAHSSMRIALPAFMYGLCLLSIINENTAIHRE